MQIPLKYQRAGLGGLFFISGFAALLYQTVWIKRLSLHFGHSAWAIATVVSVFMAGLGLGGWLAGRVSDRLARPIRWYAIIEAGVALFGVASWPLLDRLPLLLAPAYGSPLLFGALRWLTCTGILLIPTVLMGASLPVLVVSVARGGSFTKTVGLFYGLNTLGSALGALIAGFVLLPWLGVQLTLVVAVGLGIVVAVAALLLSQSPISLKGEPQSTPSTSSSGFLRTQVGLAVLCGFLALFLEIAWARLLAPVLGSSTYTFSLILFVYLCGTGLGSLLIAKFTPTLERNTTFACALIGIAAVAGLFGLPLINAMPSLFIQLAPLTIKWAPVFFATQAMLVAMLVLVPTCALGMALPCLISAHRGARSSTGPSLGVVYAFNTLGAIAGCLLTGFVLLPRVGVSNALIVVCIGVGMISALVYLFNGTEPKRQRVRIAGVALAGSLAAFAWWPRADMRLLHTGFFRSAATSTDLRNIVGYLLFLKDGVSSTVSVYRSPDQTALKVNGKTDASTSGDLSTQYLLGHLPMLFHSNPKRVCVIGYGSGATVRAVTTHGPLVAVDVVELEPAVVEASRYFTNINESVLDDPRVRIHYEDGRTFLGYGTRLFDVIISEPSNPWIAGVGSLFTREFYRQVQRRLTNDGVFCQWIQTYELSRPTLNTMLQTLAETFPHYAVFMVQGDLICVASNAPLSTTLAELTQRMKRSDVSRSLKKVRVETPFDLLLGYYANFPEDSNRFESVYRNTDNNSWLEYRAPLEMYAGLEPGLERPSTSLTFDRYKTKFFSGATTDTIAEGLAESVLRLRPFTFFRIEDMKAFVGNRAVIARMSERARVAQQRAQLLARVESAMAEAAHQIQTGNFGAAQTTLRPLEILVPAPLGLHRLLGIVAARQKRMEAALSHFNAAVEENPNDFTALTEMGRIWLSESNVPAAIACFKRALEANPQSGHAHDLLKALLPPAPHS